MGLRMMCPICLERKRLNYKGVCANCHLAVHLRERFPVPTLSREYVLSHTNDGTEYETPVMEAERAG